MLLYAQEIQCQHMSSSCKNAIAQGMEKLHTSWWKDIIIILFSKHFHAFWLWCSFKSMISLLCVLSLCWSWNYFVILSVKGLVQTSKDHAIRGLAFGLFKISSSESLGFWMQGREFSNRFFNLCYGDMITSTRLISFFLRWFTIDSFELLRKQPRGKFSKVSLVWYFTLLYSDILQGKCEL